MSDGPLKSYTTGVRALCEFAARTGDLDLRGSQSPSAQEGSAGHRTVAARRGPTWHSEMALSAVHDRLTVSGRADGYDTEARRLEEIKTHKGDLARMPATKRELHWAQAQVYGWMLCRSLDLDAIDIALVYFEIDSERETLLQRRCEAPALQRFFERLCERFIDWLHKEDAHREARDAALARLVFPHAELRHGQRALAEQSYTAARRGRALLAQAPTGIGKTLGSLFPMLKACAAQHVDRIYFLTAKGSGRVPAVDALRRLCGVDRGPGAGGDGSVAMPLRVIDLPSREKACVHPGKACHADSCPLARGHHDRLPQAREAAAAAHWLDAPALLNVALAHAVCPYHLGQEMARWSDVVVADYNHYFDAGGVLFALLQTQPSKVAVLVDEAHNLIERARSMYSAAMTSAALRGLCESTAAQPPALRSALDRLQAAWRQQTRAQTLPYVIHDAPPAAFVAALRQAIGALGECLAQSPATDPDATLLRFYFDALQFNRLIDSFGTHSLFDISLEAGGESTLCVRNLLPAVFLKPRFAAARCTVLFSATLMPHRFYADMLGLPEDAAWLDVEAPFKAEQLEVSIVRGVSTRFHQRGASLQPIARLMAAQFRARPGNYLAFFSSFDYLQRAAQVFGETHPDIAVWQQGRKLHEADRRAFLERFVPAGRGIGFAVLGGSFAEGIDLPGDRLVGAFIATLGLPQVNPVNEALRQRIDATHGAGYDYAYLYPGLRKVVQAAGRVIRSVDDTGSVHLIDDRYARPEVRRLLPAWWRIDGPADGCAHGDSRP